MKNLKKGFTLIELLVVIAIIGILTTVVLVTLNDSQNKGKKAALQKESSSILSSFNVICIDRDIQLSDIPDNVTSFDKSRTWDNGSGINQNCGPGGKGKWTMIFRNSSGNIIGACNEIKCDIS